jgi:phosphoglycerate-specific signal transduction histidine kinase
LVWYGPCTAFGMHESHQTHRGAAECHEKEDRLTGHQRSQQGVSKEMSAAQAVRVQEPAYFETPSLAPIAPETIRDLVHELRQPFSSIEAIAYFLEMTLPADQIQARQYMRRLQQLVDQAESILDRTGSIVRKQPASPSAGL